MSERKSIPYAITDILDLLVMKGKVLGVDVYRGYARLCDLANISEADVFDQKTNPQGTQRDLSPKHAKDAYNYVKESELSFWPEVFLCLREQSVITFEPSDLSGRVGSLKVDVKRLLTYRSIAISRVDGNHRLYYAGGTFPGFPAIEREVSFCLAFKLTPLEEITLFRDINDNQRRMNTSHLDNIEARLTPLEKQKRDDPALYIAKKLGSDRESPLFERIFEGGKKPGYFAIPLRSLKTGIQYMLSQPSKLTALPEVDVQYVVIRNFFKAVKEWQPDAWREFSKYIILRGVGLWAICFIGADVIDKTLSSGKYTSSDMLKILKSGKSWDWSNSGDFRGYSGRGGAVEIKAMVSNEFTDDSGISIKILAEKILKE